MIIIKAKNYKELSKKACNFVLNEIMLNPDCSIGFATGSTPIGLYKELIDKHKNMGVDFSSITTFNLDEYFPISSGNEQSYHYFMFNNLFNHINISLENINILDGNSKYPLDTCTEYEKKIKNSGIDLQILGIGANGHIGFNEPNTSFNSKTSLVNLSEKTILDNSRFFEDKNKVPTQALSMGISTIMNSKKILLMASGKNKAQAIKRMIEGSVSEDCPASILQRHPDAIIILDEDAASLLENTTVPDKVGGYKIFTEHSLPKNKTFIVISPHPDDSAIGCGGTISMLSKENKIYTFIMTSGHRSFIPETSKEDRIQIREEEVIKESNILGSEPRFLKLKYYDDKNENLLLDIDKVRKLFENIQPNIIIIPQKNDEHPTHKVSRMIALEAIKQSGLDVEIWNYESPWGLFNHSSFNGLVSIPENHFNIKLKSINCHKSQVERNNYALIAESLANLRGALIPEQELSGFGNKKIKISSKLELFFIENRS
ncbi:glucosamine-6-phosphate deaminase [Candidatus Woesearchaeota archaeon]|nr:glucosamine-6-phosphate deaminase [Candidatus Woesearchaeota archaeon]MCF7900963.1 glucosamine-6-phosphate deaminase [Candidatus Woesearchaeota archaeon]MCF8013591.1 glucosamine-6-phosphate deaminase [Candidatus Woesearchaeota archaeon]